jgi:hypothetical protein
MRSIRWIFGGAAILIVVIGLIFFGGQVPICLGPLNRTWVQCIAAINAGPEPDYSPGPAEGAWVAVGAGLLLVAIAILPWRRPSIWAVAGLFEAGAVGAIIGAIAYELTRETSLTGPTSSGRIITVTFGPNAADRELHAAIGAGLAIITAAVMVTRWRPDPH